MIKFEIDFAELEKYVASLGAASDQIPYAVALALNRSAEVTRNLLIRHTWPSSGITVRESSFIGASLTTREARATKGSLSVEIYDRLRRGNLMLHAKGGTRVARGGSMAVPVGIRKGPKGVPDRLRPAAMPVRKGEALFMRDANGRLRLTYVLKKATKVPKRVPFYEDYAASMSRELHRTLPMAVARAMATRRR